MNYVSEAVRLFRRKVNSLKLKRAILASQLFSPEWYLESYPDVVAANVDPYAHYMEFGWREGRDPGPNFGTEAYLSANPDVRSAGVNPLAHYILCGKAEGRVTRGDFSRRRPYRKLASGVSQDRCVAFERSSLSAPPENRLLDNYTVAFLIGCLEGESKRYRVFNVIEALKSMGIDAAHFRDIDIPEQLGDILSHDIIVLFRYPWSANVDRLIEEARAKSIPLVYDVDDYIFDPAIASRVDGVRMLSEEGKIAYVAGALRYRQTLESCDYATAPTEFLANMQSFFVNKAYVIANTMNSEQLRIYRSIASDGSQAPADKVTLGYFSGTLTHQKDFEQAYPALARLLQDLPNVSLMIKGEFRLEEFPDLKKFGRRVTLAPFSDWRELPQSISQIDINLIPLEHNSLFCESKSELKYFETAILGIPSVVSEVGPYKYVIKHGHNGLLARTPEDWYVSLKSLSEDKSLRKRIGQAAKDHVAKTYVPETLALNADTVYRDILSDHRRRRRRASRKSVTSISFVAPCPKPGSGGHKDIFLLGNVLSDLGYEVNIYFIPDGVFHSTAHLEEAIFDHFVEPKFNSILGVDVTSCDALFATHYSTADYVKENLAKAKRGFYFVQDYEPYFHPVNEDYIRAARTYSMGFHCITLGPWLREMLRQKHGCEAEVIPFWIERDIYYPRTSPNGGRPKLVFLSRPEMPRRCFYLGVEALNIFHKLNPEVEILLFGSAETKNHKLPFKHTDLGVVHKSNLGALYAEAQVGLVFSPTNPSFVPYEMMASGCPVVDISMDKEFDHLKYGSAGNAVLTPPDPHNIASALQEVITNKAKRKALVSNALEFVNELPSVEQSGEAMESIIRKALALR